MTKKFAFTLSEVLITLAVIGVVAALTLPNVITNYQKKVTVAKLKKEYSKVSQILLNSYNDNGETTREEFHSGNEYITTHWLKYIKNPKLYNSPPYKKCSSSNFTCIYTIRGTEQQLYIVNDVYSEDGFYMFSDGETIYYLTSSWNTGVYEIFIDINGSKKPNTIGKDIFLFGLDIKKGRLLDRLSNSSSRNDNAYLINQCKNSGHDCAAKIIRDGWEIKSDYPW